MITSFHRDNGMPPTVYEIADAFGVSTPTAFSHLQALQKKGYIERSSKARSLSLLRTAAPQHLSLSLSVPILGRISAGEPLFAEQHVEEHLTIDPTIVPGGASGHRLFGLRVRGESMRDLGILDGDIVIARDQPDAKPGDVVVALVEDEEATIKTFHPDGEVIELLPANSDFAPQRYAADQVRIQGVVVALQRTL
jgi:repressor LexA